MARKQKFDYFEAFIKLSENAVKYSEALVQYMEKNAQIASEGREPEIEHAIQRFEELHKYEEECDVLRADVAEALSTEFLAPIEREDIMVLASQLDALVDDLDEVLQRMYMYDVHIVLPSVVQMMKLAHESTASVNGLCKLLPNFKKPAMLKEKITAAHTIESDADKVYIQAMHDCFARGKESDMDSAEVFGQSQLLTCLEEVCDACEDVANTITMVIMKNS